MRGSGGGQEGVKRGSREGEVRDPIHRPLMDAQAQLLKQQRGGSQRFHSPVQALIHQFR
jgi:hypothetical protein